MQASYFTFLIQIVVLLLSNTPVIGQNKKPLKKADKVLVVKSTRKLYLLNGADTIKTYTVALGRNPIGQKEKQGDKKTPEGNYILDWRNSQSSFYKSIHISYPNEEDRKRAVELKVPPGGSVMLHGLGSLYNSWGTSHTQTDWTDGCIAVTDEEIDEIWNTVADGTPIEIRK